MINAFNQTLNKKSIGFLNTFLSLASTLNLDFLSLHCGLLWIVRIHTATPYLNIVETNVLVCVRYLCVLIKLKKKRGKRADIQKLKRGKREDIQKLLIYEKLNNNSMAINERQQKDKQVHKLYIQR